MKSRKLKKIYNQILRDNSLNYLNYIFIKAKKIVKCTEQIHLVYLTCVCV